MKSLSENVRSLIKEKEQKLRKIRDLYLNIGKQEISEPPLAWNDFSNRGDWNDWNNWNQFQNWHNH